MDGEAKLSSYDFKDSLGHPLTNCKDFQYLLAEMKVLKAEKAQAEAERDRLIKALTPSIETKRAYMSEVRNDTQQGDFVSWCAIKDIMKLIRSRAKQQTEKQGEQE